MEHLIQALQLEHALMVYLTGYFDESYSNMEQKTYVVAGYADYSQKWPEFAIEWAKRLEEPRRIDYYHSEESANRQGQFKGFSEQERNDKAKRMLQLICEFRPVAIISAVRGKDYEELRTKYPDALVPENPYHFCMENVWIESCDLAQEIGASQIAFVFDRNDEHEAEARAAYKYARKTVIRFRTYFDETVSFADKKKHKPLQAADTIAYDVNKLFRLRIRNPQEKMRKSLGVVIDHCPIRGIEWQQEYLEKFFIKRTKTK